MKGTVTVRRNGTITIPYSIRKYLKISDGDTIEIDVQVVHNEDHS